MDEKKRIEAVHEKVMELIQITNDLEALYPENPLSWMAYCLEILEKCFGNIPLWNTVV